MFSQLSQISNLLQVMRMDMTNYAIRQIRPLVQKQHIEQQREYFEKWAQGTSLKLFCVSEFKGLPLKIAPECNTFELEQR